jgi:spore coat polysaccharide biosynthesis protein SpsF (cytidylyltransferase family)
MRWTVDQKQDLTFVRKIYAKMKPKTIFSMKEILKIISEDPELQNINKGIKRNEGYTKSLKNDHKINFKR